MTFDTLSKAFNRAFAYSLTRKKFFLVYLTLFLTGILLILFEGVGQKASQWMKLNVTFLPLFLSSLLLLPLGILVIRLYHDEIKGKEISYLNLLSKSWEVLVAVSYFVIPVVAGYLFLWILLGVFLLLQSIPYAGTFFSLFLIAFPFVINLTTLLLSFLSIALLFFIPPLLALREIKGYSILESIFKRLQKNLFENLFLLLVGLLPLAAAFLLLWMALHMTESLCLACHTTMRLVIKWFFISIPLTAFLTPFVTFFFNFSVEAYMIALKK